MATNSATKCLEERVLLDLLGDKWTLVVFGSLCDSGGRRRFNAIRRDIRDVSQKSLTQCLRRLERNGLIARHVTHTAPPSVEYAFTELGLTICSVVGSLRTWTEQHGNAVLAAQAAYDAKVPMETTAAEA